MIATYSKKLLAHGIYDDYPLGWLKKLLSEYGYTHAHFESPAWSEYDLIIRVKKRNGPLLTIKIDTPLEQLDVDTVQLLLVEATLNAPTQTNVVLDTADWNKAR